MRAINTETLLETSDEEIDVVGRPRDLKRIMAHNACQLEILADTLQTLALEHEKFLETGDLKEYVETVDELLDEPLDELCYPTKEQRALVREIQGLFDEFRGQVQEAESLLNYLDEEQEKKNRAQLRAYLKANGYADTDLVEHGWLLLLAGVVFVILLAYWSCA